MDRKETERYLVISLRQAQMHVGKAFMSKTVLAQLFDLSQHQQNIVLLDADGEEVPYQHGLFVPTDPRSHYTIVTQQDIDEEEEQSFTPQEKMLHVFKVEQLRSEFIQKNWKPVHPWLYSLTPEHMHPQFLANCFSAPEKLSDTLAYHVRCMFSPKFCADLIEEVNAMEASGLPLVRPNTMNRYGIVLKEFGFDKLWQDLLNVHLLPIFSRLYPDVGPHLDHQHAFIVQYKESEDTGLDFHYDDSEVTVNLCLGKQFTGGDLYFRGLLTKPETHSENLIYHHAVGEAVFHLGEHRHGAMDITGGERYNLILWYRSSSVREKRFAEQHHNH